MLAAKVNVLASRFSFYHEKIRPIEKQFEDWQNHGHAPETNAKAKLDELNLEQMHLVCRLDRQTEALGVGLKFECPDSPYNERLRDLNKAQTEAATCYRWRST
jgi:hypothetical protein